MSKTLKILGLLALLTAGSIFLWKIAYRCNFSPDKIASISIYYIPFSIETPIDLNESNVRRGWHIHKTVSDKAQMDSLIRALNSCQPSLLESLGGAHPLDLRVVCDIVFKDFHTPACKVLVSDRVININDIGYDNNQTFKSVLIKCIGKDAQQRN